MFWINVTFLGVHIGQWQNPILKLKKKFLSYLVAKWVPQSQNQFLAMMLWGESLSGGGGGGGINGRPFYMTQDFVPLFFLSLCIQVVQW